MRLKSYRMKVKQLKRSRKRLEENTIPPPPPPYDYLNEIGIYVGCLLVSNHLPLWPEVGQIPVYRMRCS